MTLMSSSRAGAVAAALLTLMSAPTPARDVADLYKASVTVSDRGAQEFKRGTAAALAQVVVKLTGNRQMAADGRVKAVLAKASNLMIQYAYGEAAVGALQLVATFDGAALTRELGARDVPVWGKERPDTLTWLVIDDGSGRQVPSSDEPGVLGTVLEHHAGQRAVPLVLPLMDIGEAQQLAKVADWSALCATAAVLSLRYATPAALLGYLRQSAPGLWEAHWQLNVDAESLEWTQEGDIVELMVEEGVDALADALARRFAAPALLSGAEQLSLTVVGVRTAADYARLSNYLESLDTVTKLFVRSIDTRHVIFDITARGGRAALGQSIAFGQVLAPLAAQADAYELRP